MPPAPIVSPDPLKKTPPPGAPPSGVSLYAAPGSAPVAPAGAPPPAAPAPAPGAPAAPPPSPAGMSSAALPATAAPSAPAGVSSSAMPTTSAAGTLPAAGTYAGVDPGRSFDAASARQHLEAILGRPMTPAEMQQAASIAGYGGSGMISGEQLNKVIQAGAGLAGKPFSPFAAAAAGGAGGSTLPAGMEDQIFKKIQDLLNPKGYDPNAPENVAQKNVMGAQNQRAAERRRAQMAERAAARGETGAGGFDVEVDKINADRGMADAAFEADLMKDELQNQRAQLMQALEMGRGIMGDRETRALQEKLGLLDAEIRKMGIKQQGELGRGDLAVRLRQLAQGDRHFYDNLGSENSRWLADYNQKSLRDILGAF